MFRLTGRLPAIIFCVALPFGFGACATQRSHRPVAKPAPAKTAKTVPQPRNDGFVWNARAYPTGERATSAILVERGAPAEVQANQPYDYEIRVTNLTDHKLESVIVRDAPGKGFVAGDSSPRAVATDGGLQWTLGDLAPHATRTIRVSGKAPQEGSVTCCCEVDWQSSLCATTRVVRPEIALIHTATREEIVCEPVVFQYTVTNRGSGTAREVVIEHVLPQGLETKKGQSAIRIPVGDLGAGKSKSFKIACKGSRTGVFENVAKATAAGGLEITSAKTTTRLTRPVLEITQKGPARAFIGRTLEYEITVKNTGDGVAGKTVIENPLPAGTRFLGAADGGRLTKEGNAVRWSLGALAPGQARTVNLRLRAADAASFRNVARAQAYCAKPVQAAVDTETTGIPAILLEVVDVEDPIEVGGQSVYLVTVTNQGTAPGTNIRIACELEDTMAFVSSSGATQSRKAGESSILFAPLARLGVKEKASWRVVVNAAKDGDVRFKVKLTSDQLERPVEETEATNFYK